MNNYSEAGIVNVGTGTEISIAALTKLICDKLEWHGPIVWNSEKPNGALRKVVDVSLLTRLGWVPKVSLDEGLDRTLAWFTENQEAFRR